MFFVVFVKMIVYKSPGLLKSKCTCILLLLLYTRRKVLKSLDFKLERLFLAIVTKKIRNLNSVFHFLNLQCQYSGQCEVTLY